MIKDNYLNYLNELKDVVNDDKTLKIINELKERIQNTELLIPVVGAFSAGKSTLINNFLDNSNTLGGGFYRLR